MKAKIDKSTAFNGVVVLTLALLVVKVLSAVYRVPYQNILGDEGLYAYQQVYPIVALGVILTMNAIPSAVTQIFGSEGDFKQYTRVMIRIQSISAIFFLILLFCAKWVALLMGDINLTPMLRAASFSFLFIGILGVFRGYYQAQRDMNVPAISQVIEQFVRVGIIISAIILFMIEHWSIYAAGTLAIIGSAFGFLASSLFLILRKPFKHSQKKSYEFAQKPFTEWRKLALAILIFAVSQLIVIVWQVVDSFTVLHMLQSTGLDFQQATSQKGVYDRGASFIQMGLIVTTTFCFVLIPLLTDAIKARNKVLTNRYANASIKITILFSVSAGVGLINLMPIMNSVFFKTNSQTLTLAVYMLTVICVSLIMMDIALLQVKNKVRPVLLAFSIGVVSKTVLNIALIPQLLMLGGSISTVVSLILFTIVLHKHVLKYYLFQSMRKYVIKLIVTMFILSIVVQITMWLIPEHGRIIGLIELVMAAGIGVIVIVIAIVRTNLLSYRELKHLPFGDKLYHMKRGER
ncbi:polysaccharide biosynthesis protein [Staphylococcus shinii]|uniref:polysaccharide biosynthesis protein n=1 Tax=Staphylococcus shinii TaxID=2912228 RepID=UPI003F547438